MGANEALGGATLGEAYSGAWFQNSCSATSKPSRSSDARALSGAAPSAVVTLAGDAGGEGGDSGDAVDSGNTGVGAAPGLDRTALDSSMPFDVSGWS
jgi:hypothetical protein